MTKEELHEMKVRAQERWKQVPRLGLAGESARDIIRLISEIEKRDKEIEELKDGN